MGNGTVKGIHLKPEHLEALNRQETPARPEPAEAITGNGPIEDSWVGDTLAAIEDLHRTIEYLAPLAEKQIKHQQAVRDYHAEKVPPEKRALRNAALREMARRMAGKNKNLTTRAISKILSNRFSVGHWKTVETIIRTAIPKERAVIFSLPALALKLPPYRKPWESPGRFKGGNHDKIPTPRKARFQNPGRCLARPPRCARPETA